MAIITLFFNFTLFVMNFYAISKNTNEIFLQCIVKENQVRVPNHNLGHPENFYTGLDLNPTLLLYLHIRMFFLTHDLEIKFDCCFYSGF